MYKKGEEFLCGRLFEDGRLSKDYRDWVVVHSPPKPEPGKNIYPLKWASVFHVAEGNQQIRAYDSFHLGLEIDLGVGESSDSGNPPRGTIISDSCGGTPYPRRASLYTFIKVTPYTNRVVDGLLFFAEKEGGVAPYKFRDYVTLVFKDAGDADVVYSTLSLFKDAI